MLDFIKVNVPKERTIIAKSGKNEIKYVYYILKSYRNKNNQPTGKTISIGRYDEKSDKLIPNNNFFDIFDCDITIKVNGLKNKGDLDE